MPSVFISYVREDRETVQRLVDTLEQAGIDVLWDQNPGLIEPGARWRQRVRRAIENGDFCIACFSVAYARRVETPMNWELGLAVERLAQMPQDRIWFIPVLLNGDSRSIPDISIGNNETLRDLHWADLASNWGKETHRIVALIAPDPTLPAIAAAPQPPTDRLERIRDILTRIGIDQLARISPDSVGCSPEELFRLMKLMDAQGLVRGGIRTLDGTYHQVYLTPEGSAFLDAACDDVRWAQARNIAAEHGISSLSYVWGILRDLLDQELADDY